MDKLISIIFLALTALSYVVVASIASRGVSTKDSYLLGDRQFHIPSITLTLIATQLGAGMFFGTAKESYDNGLFGIAYVLGMAFGLIILGLGIGARLRSLNISTTAELFERKYHSKGLRRFAALISILTMGGILSAQIVASKQLFLSLFDMSSIWLILFWICVIAYTTFGGLRAIVATDILQVIMIVVIFSAVLFYVVPPSEILPTLKSKPSGGLGPLFSQGFFAALIAPVLFSMIEQDLAQRCFAAKTKMVATISAILAALFLLTYALVPITFGMYAKSIGIVSADGQSPLVLLFQSKLSTFGMTVVACALLAAICSTADSLLGAASTNLIADFLPEEEFSLRTARLLTFVVGIIALVIAFNFDDVIQIIVKSYEVSVCALFIPIFLALFMRSPKKISAVISVALGTISYLAMSIFSSSSSPMMVALVMSAAGFLAGEIFGQRGEVDH